MIAKRVGRRLAIAAAAVGVVASFTVPVASADNLSNGLTVTCNPVGPNQLTCVIGGCPRPDGVHVVDALHVMDNGYQFEYKDWSCINGATITHNAAIIIDSIGPQGYTFGFQGCRKYATSSDLCTPYANYTWKPPAKQAPPPPPKPQTKQCPDGGPTIPVGDQCPAPKPQTKQCPDGGPTIPVTDTCPAPKPVTDAITLSFGPPGFGNITATVSNSSDLPGKCTYDANPLGTHRDFTVNAHGSTQLTFSGINAGIKYHAVVTCQDASGKQTQPIGTASADVRF